MAENVIEIILQAEVDQATKQIQKFAKTVGVEIKEGISIYDAFEAKLKEVEQALKKASDPADVAKLTKQLQATRDAFNNIRAGNFGNELNKVGKAAANATPTLTNFSRVIQDAPFGIIGVANNIDPLIQSFQSLQKQSGSTTGALKSLFAGLAGPTGILIGVSAVTSALVAFGPEIANAISGISALEQAQRAAGEEGAKAFAKGRDELANLTRIATDSSNSFERQNDALSKVNGLLDDYGLKVESVAALQENGAKIGVIYAQIKQEEARAQVLAAKAAEAYARQISIQIKGQQGDAFGLLSEFSFGDQIQALFGNIIEPGSTATAVINGYNNATAKAAEEEKLFNNEAEKSRLAIDGLIKQLGNVNGVKEQFGKAVKSTIPSLEQQRKILNELYAPDAPTTKGITTLAQLTDEQARSTITLANNLEKARLAQQKKNEADKAAALLGVSRGPQAAPANVAQGRGISAAFTEAEKKNAQVGIDLLKQIETATQNTNAAFQLFAPAIDQAFNALANGQNAADAVKQALKQLIVQLIKAAIQAAILSAILSALPGGAAASGGFRGIFSGLLGFRANGGPVSDGRAFVVGENGPELFVPNTAGNIVPNNSLQQQQGNVAFEIRGDVLLGILKRTQGNRVATFG